jgi:hypothetical protein
MQDHMITTRLGLYAALCFLMTPAWAAEDPIKAVKKGQPKDVALFMDRYVQCNHWGGEEPYDADRRKEILAAVTRLRCQQLDADEKALLKKYWNTPSVSDAIKQTRQQFE